MQAVIRIELANKAGTPIGVLRRKLDGETPEEIKSNFGLMKDHIIEEVVRFYLTEQLDQMLVFSPTGTWTDFKRPKGATRLYPGIVALLFSDDPRWEEKGPWTEDQKKNESKPRHPEL